MNGPVFDTFGTDISYPHEPRTVVLDVYLNGYKQATATVQFTDSGVSSTVKILSWQRFP